MPRRKGEWDEVNRESRRREEEWRGWSCGIVMDVEGLRREGTRQSCGADRRVARV